jgi:ABC-type branched-subunit amino acid transport system substrate-binding protein
MNRPLKSTSYIVEQLLERTRRLWLGPKSIKTPSTPPQRLDRRNWLIQTIGNTGVATVLGANALIGTPSAWGQSSKTNSKPLLIAQVVDTSIEHQDVTKDFLIGSRAAWQDINSTGGVKGRLVNHSVFEIDSSPNSVRATIGNIRINADFLAIVGTAADPLAVSVSEQLHDENIAHIAPWLQNSSIGKNRNTFSIFSTRREQIAYALHSLSTMGTTALGVVFATISNQTQNLSDIEAIAKALKLQIQIQPLQDDLRRAGERINSSTAAVILFVGGTPELAQFTQGLDKQARQRYVVALSDINMQTLQQMGASKVTPVIVTQAVPMVKSSLPVVRKYREVLAKLYDEPPSSLSLAGFISARYTFEILQSMDVPISRSNVLEALNRRRELDIGGFRVAYIEDRRSSTYVTQSMLTQDGRVIG